MPLSDAFLLPLRRFLDPGEEVVWAGQPIPARAMRSSLPVLLFAIPWTAFSLFWMGMAGAITWFSSAPMPGGMSLFPFFGIPFVLIGLAMLSSPYWAWRAAQRTVYVVTDRRALVGRPAQGGMTFTAYGPNELDDLTLTVRPDGSGTVTLRPQETSAASSRSSFPTAPRADAFVDIPDVERVFDLLRGLARRRGAALDLPEAEASSASTLSDFAREAGQNAPGWRGRA